MNGEKERHAARLPNRSRLAFCCGLRGGNLNRRAALPPRILCLAFSERNGRSQIWLGTSKTQWRESDGERSCVSPLIIWEVEGSARKVSASMCCGAEYNPAVL